MSGSHFSQNVISILKMHLCVYVLRDDRYLWTLLDILSLESLECCRTCEKRHLFSSWTVSWTPVWLTALLTLSDNSTARGWESTGPCDLVSVWNKYMEDKTYFQFVYLIFHFEVCWRPGVALVFLTACFWMNNISLLSQKAIQGTIYIVVFFSGC